MSFIDWELENFPQNFGKLRCSTVIDRQTLTHVICNMDSPEGVERDVFARVMSEVAKTLDKVPFCEIEQQSEWVSVKDRLPEREQYDCVLVCCTMNVTSTINYENAVTMAYVCEEGFMDVELNEFITGGVTHWMPLPPPPKEEPT